MPQKPQLTSFSRVILCAEEENPYYDGLIWPLPRKSQKYTTVYIHKPNDFAATAIRGAFLCSFENEASS